MKTYAIILASGKGTRYESDIPKQFVKIGNKTILERSIEAFENNSKIDNIILVITPEYKSLATEIIDKNNYKKLYKIVDGGELRKDSSYNGVFSIVEDEANVLIHDCARPFVSQRIINESIDALTQYDAVNVGIPCTDTIIYVENNIIKEVPNRDNLLNVQTPQSFKLSVIKKAHSLALNETLFTDDCSLVLKYNLAEVFVIKGDTNNIKITYPQDYYLAEQICKQ